MMSELQKAIESWQENKQSPQKIREVNQQIRKMAQQIIQQRGVPFAHAEELAQEVTHKMWELLTSGYAKQGSEVGLLYRLVRNQAVEWHRSRHRKEVLSDPSYDLESSNPSAILPFMPQSDNSSSVNQSPEEEYLREESLITRSRALEELFHQMPPSPRYVMIRLYVDGLSISEVAQERLEAEYGGDLSSFETRTEIEKNKLWKKCHDWVTKNKERGIDFLKDHLSKEHDT